MYIAKREERTRRVNIFGEVRAIRIRPARVSRAIRRGTRKGRARQRGCFLNWIERNVDKICGGIARHVGSVVIDHPRSPGGGSKSSRRPSAGNCRVATCCCLVFEILDDSRRYFRAARPDCEFTRHFRMTFDSRQI